MEFASAGWRRKPVTKSQIRKLQAAFELGDEIAKQNREREKNDEIAAEEEMDDLLSGV